MSENFDLDLVTTLGVKSVNLTFGMKRTVKKGDEYQSVEASESWTLKHDTYEEIPPSAARMVTLVHGPRIIKNVLMSLYVGGVLPKAEAMEIAERVRTTYAQLIGEKRDPGGDQPDLSHVGQPGDPAGAEPGTGDRVPDGPAPGVP